MTHTLRLILVSIGLLLVCGPQTVALADEVFICDGNKVVRVALNKLDHMKRTHACVAAHYGLKVAAVPAAVKAGDTGRVHKLISGPTRAKRPTRAPKKAAQTRKAESGKVAKVKTSLPKKTARLTKPEFKVYRQDEALPVEEIAAGPSDYRNVRVLNAKSQPAQWHRHVY